MCQKQYTSLHQQSANTTFKLTNMKCCFQQTAEFQHLPFRCRHEQLKVFYAFSISLQSLHHEYHARFVSFEPRLLPWKCATMKYKKLYRDSLASLKTVRNLWAKKVTFLTKNEIILCQITKLDSFIILVLDFLNIFMLLLFFFLISCDFILYSSVSTALLLFKDQVLPAYCW